MFTLEPEATAVAIWELNEAESILYDTSSTIESMMSVLKSLNNPGVINPLLLFGKLDWFTASNCVLVN
jgi:hypothetical protein